MRIMKYIKSRIIGDNDPNFYVIIECKPTGDDFETYEYSEIITKTPIKMDQRYWNNYKNNLSYLTDVKFEDRVFLSYFDDSSEMTNHEVATILDSMSGEDILKFKEHIEELKEKYNKIPYLEKSITRVRTMFNNLK